MCTHKVYTIETGASITLVKVYIATHSPGRDAFSGSKTASRDGFVADFRNIVVMVQGVGEVRPRAGGNVEADDAAVLIRQALEPRPHRLRSRAGAVK